MASFESPPSPPNEHKINGFDIQAVPHTPDQPGIERANNELSRNNVFKVVAEIRHMIEIIKSISNEKELTVTFDDGQVSDLNDDDLYTLNNDGLDEYSVAEVYELETFLIRYHFLYRNLLDQLLFNRANTGTVPLYNDLLQDTVKFNEIKSCDEKINKLNAEAVRKDNVIKNLQKALQDYFLPGSTQTKRRRTDD